MFFHYSLKRQRYLEHTLALENKTQKLKGLCKTRWVERHECLETFYLYVITCLHAMLEPNMYPDLAHRVNDEDWSWVRETLTKASGLKLSLTNFVSIILLVVLKNSLHPVKGLTSKLQKRNSDIYHAHQMIDFRMPYLFLPKKSQKPSFRGSHGNYSVVQ